MTRNEMMNSVVKKFGYEDSRTIWFFELCEQYPNTESNNKHLESIVGSLFVLAQHSAALEK